MRRRPRTVLVAVLALILTVLPVSSAEAYTPADAVNDAVGYGAARGVTEFISVVDRSTGAVLAQTGNANSQVASESIMKLLLAGYYLVLYGGHASTPQDVKDRLSYMLRYSDDDTASSLFSPNAVPTMAARYGMPNTTNAMDRVGHWGAVRITAADMTTFLWRASQDAAVGPWLLPVMAQTAATGSGEDAGFNQHFGLNALSGDHGSKQGWGCDSYWTTPDCAVHSVGYTARTFVAVLQLSDGYPDPMRETATHAAAVIQGATIKPVPIGSVDVVANWPGGTLYVSGWAADPGAPGQVEQLDIYISANGGPLTGAGNIRTGGSRPDVSAIYPWAGASTGYVTAVPAAGLGLNRVCVFAIDVNPPRANPLLGCRDMQVSAMVGMLDSAVVGYGRVTVRGWAVNPNMPTQGAGVHVYDFGPAGQVGYSGFATTGSRPDVGALFPGYGSAHGFSVQVRTTDPGQHRLCAFGIPGGRLPNQLLGCKLVQLPNVFGALDSVTVSGGRATARGWAANPNAPGTAVEVHVIDFRPTGMTGYTGFSAAASRPDVAAAYPGLGAGHGYTASVPVSQPGKHTICAYAVSPGGYAGNPILGCRDFTI